MILNEYKLANVIDKPIISEKSSKLADFQNTFVFKVNIDANKIEIKQAVEIMFAVEVASVNILNQEGKSKRFGRSLGKRSDWKKAYVKLKAGSEIDFSVA
ncbi:MAG: 50S ribosomal protein L23 [Methylovulum sp.]|jgi:large subunit ribosomal protein L23|nr:50S ribosomal protein L23 [Methylovulum sp.]TSA40589.1 MAG: 50S ribosomal protein L23 [Methylococcaceae bacterium]